MKELAKQDEATMTGVLARLDQLDRDLRSTVEQTGNTLAAYMGEIEDRIEQAAGGDASSKTA